MKPLHLSPQARESLALLQATVLSAATSDIDAIAARLHGLHRDEAHDWLSRESVSLQAAMVEKNPAESQDIIGGMVFAFCECVNDRLAQLDAAAP